MANFNSPLTFFGLSMSTMSIWLQSILVRFKFPVYFYVFPNDLKWLQNSRFWMETTTFMVTKAKRGIYQLFNFSLCGQLFINRVMKIGMLLIWFPRPQPTCCWKSDGDQFACLCRTQEWHTTRADQKAHRCPKAEVAMQHCIATQNVFAHKKS